MATNTYYSKEYTYKNNYKYRAALTLTTSSTANQYTVNWTIAVQAQHGYLYGMAVTGSGECSGTASGYLPSSPGSTWKTVNSKSGSKTYTKTTSSQAKSFTAKAYGTMVNGIGSAGGSGVSITQTITIPALASYTITYDANEGYGPPGKQIKYYGITATLSSTVPTRANYKFSGWYNAKTGGSKYTTYSGNASITFYAHWEATGNVITYNPNGGNYGKVKSQNKAKGVSFVPSDRATPSRIGYNFDGWYTGQDDQSDIVDSDHPYRNDADITLYAHWSKITYTITYYSNTSDTTPPEESTKDYGVDQVLANPTYSAGYVFLGWATSEDGEVVYLPGDSYKDNANINLYAIYKSGYVPPQIGNLSCIRLDACGKESNGGERIKLEFSSTPAKTGPSEVNNNETHVIVFKSMDGENYTAFDQYNTESGKILKTYDSDNNIGIKDYSYFKIIITDISQFSATSDSSFDETKDYYTRITVNSNYYYFERIDNPSGSTSGAYELSKSDAVQEYLISRVKIDEKRNVGIIENSIVCERDSSTSTTGILSFNFTPFYDGNIPYVTTVFKVYYKLIENDSESEKTPQDITETIVLENIEDYYDENEGIKQHEVSFELNNLPIDKKIEVGVMVESFSNESSPKRYPEDVSKFYEIKIKDISIGGFVFHINETGDGISFFGIASPELNGIEINKPFVLNGEATLNNKVTLNNKLEANEEAIFNKINIERNGLTINATDSYGIVLQQNTPNADAGIKISRADKDFHLFCGIGLGGVNHGVWSNANPEGWMIHKNNGFVYANNGKVLLNSNNVLLITSGAYMTAGQDYYFKDNQTVLQQMLGVVLVWSHMTPGSGSSSAVANNWGWQYTFIPKWHVETHDGQGIYIKLQQQDGTLDTYKYIYLYDTHIKGNSVNSNYGTGYDNRLACLRAVIGI